MPPKPRKRVTFITWCVLWGIFVPCDVAKLGLLALNVIPGLGTAIDGFGSLFIGFIEDLFGYGSLWIFGFYRKGNNMVANTIATFGVAALNFIPIVDDLPFTSPSVYYMILRAKATDKLEEHEYRRVISKAVKAREREQQERYVAGMQAMQNVQLANDN